VNPNVREVAVVARTWHVWRAALAAAVVLVAPPALAAQKETDPQMPLPPGVIREKGLEAQAPPGEGTREFLQIYRVGAPSEMVYTWYKKKLGGTDDAKVDTAALRPGESTLPRFRVTYHTFGDQCADAGTNPSVAWDTTIPCKHWRRGFDKRRALDNSRVGINGEGWIERFTLTWFTRGDNGELVRRQIEVRDTGLANNWQHDFLRSQITLERAVVSPPKP
jgi:hypothetical protein